MGKLPLGKYYVVGGINHTRYVGINKDTGQAYDFYFMNIGGYRPPVTEEEAQACYAAGKAYYNHCVLGCTTIGDFFMSTSSIVGTVEIAQWHHRQGMQ